MAYRPPARLALATTPNLVPPNHQPSTPLARWKARLGAGRAYNLLPPLTLFSAATHAAQIWLHADVLFIKPFQVPSPVSHLIICAHVNDNSPIPSISYLIYQVHLPALVLLGCLTTLNVSPPLSLPAYPFNTSQLFPYSSCSPKYYSHLRSAPLPSRRQCSHTTAKPHNDRPR